MITSAKIQLLRRTLPLRVTRGAFRWVLSENDGIAVLRAPSWDGVLCHYRAEGRHGHLTAEAALEDILGGNLNALADSVQAEADRAEEFYQHVFGIIDAYNAGSLGAPKRHCDGSDNPDDPSAT